MPENEGSGDADIGSKTQVFDSQTSEIYSLQTTTTYHVHNNCNYLSDLPILCINCCM